MSEAPNTQSQFDEIVWPTEGPLAQKETSTTGRPTVELLCNNGQVTNWCTEGPYAGAKIPHTYDIDGTTIQFLPYWHHYSVGGINLNIPTSQEDLDKDVTAVEHLQSRGQLPPNSQ
ncbi:hypothetical protein HOG17_05195 [Candidatus Peregrinibacteria bacterium]|jgi:hypothetical protein|nr:hypothetical protein [Candidatus Peregrinibacteria bacterium]MBT4147808.1 hypothetical protein [Candidatus Peregrinibacteria bacterium]MBT4365826.1 hypothetical protein [Candidatus Peregrinibacteria bacterium]MBT4455675.1 hypothetical protein [Candidatus Peregrinibacteria bacterium]